MVVFCDYCGFKAKSKRGLRQHVDGKSECLAKEREKAQSVLRTGIIRKVPLATKVPPFSTKPCRMSLGDEDQFDEEVTKVPAFASMPRRNRPRGGDLSSDDDTESPVGAVNKKRKQVRGFYSDPLARSAKKQSTIGQMKMNVGLKLGLSPEKLGILEKYLAMATATEQQGQNSEDNEEELEEIDGTLWDDSSQEVLDIVAPDVEIENGAPGSPQDDAVEEGGVQDPDYNNDRQINIGPNTVMRGSFQEYCARGKRTRHGFTKVQARSIRLMAKLRKKSAPLSMYTDIMEWYHRENGDIKPRQKLKDLPDGGGSYLSRKLLIKFLAQRYNMEDKKPRQHTVKLPNSKAKVTLTTFNAWHCIEQLLTDPRVNDADYNFHNNDPLSVPPPVGKISELHTGKAYYEAYQKFIKFPGQQVLLPITMYIDGAVTGQFMNLPITRLNIALGIHTRKHRDKDLAWRTLGHVAQVSKASSRGKSIFHQTGHLDSQLTHLSDDEGGEDATKDVSKAQDFHTMLDRILDTFVEVQTKGFVWDLRYRGKTYKDVEFVPFVMFIKCDTDEGDQLCGSYKSRTANVAQLCRYCTCPTQNSDMVLANYPPKTTEMIQKLVDAEDLASLKAMSQQMIQNAWYRIRFHPANDHGVHGATPGEMLHQLLLGTMKYTRESWFEQIGPTSKLAREINALAQQYGTMFGRHAERDIPKCQFKQGIQKGKLMAKEYRGILLVMAAVMRSEKGRALLMQNKNFATEELYQDWADLIEILLEWEAFLNEPEMDFRHVAKMSRKNRYIMYTLKRVAKRNAGMGWRLMKFHAILHIWMDIILYGVPLEVDTGSNESGHKETKIAAKLTQKNEETFDYQTATRLFEFMLYDLAVAELNEDRCMWEYYDRPADPLPKPPPPHPAPKTSGVRIWVYQDDKYGKDPVYSMGTGPQSREPSAVEWDDELVLFLFELQFKLKIERLEIRGQHKREGIIFRGHPDFRERPWRDWVNIDWGEYTYPGQIWCFVVVDSIIDGVDDPVQHGQIDLYNGTYAVIECAYPDRRDSEKKKSSLFLPINKEVALIAKDDRPWKRKFFLADVEAITKPLVVVPNIGGKSGIEYLIVRPRNEWVDIFKDWLDDSHQHDIIGHEEPVPLHHIPELPDRPYMGYRCAN